MMKVSNKLLRTTGHNNVRISRCLISGCLTALLCLFGVITLSVFGQVKHPANAIGFYLLCVVLGGVLFVSLRVFPRWDKSLNRNWFVAVSLLALACICYSFYRFYVMSG